MSELKPCPHCGEEPIEHAIEAHKHYLINLPDYPGSFVIECVCGAGSIGDTRDEAKAKWNRRAQPAQAGQEQVKCYEVVHGTTHNVVRECELPKGVHNALMRAVASSGKKVERPAQAGQVLTDAEIGAALEECDFYETREANFYAGARWAEQTVLAKRVPHWIATSDQVPPVGVRVFWFDMPSNTVGFDAYMGDGYSWASSHWMPFPQPPGIVGEKGGA